MFLILSSALVFSLPCGPGLIFTFGDLLFLKGKVCCLLPPTPPPVRCDTIIQLFSPVWLFATPWTLAPQASLCFTVSGGLLKFMSIESMMPSNHLILCCLLLLLPSIFPSIRVFSKDSALCVSDQRIAVSASASVFPMNIQDWFPLRLTGWISLQSKGLSRVFSNTTVQKHQFFSAHASLWPYSHICAWLLQKPSFD